MSMRGGSERTRPTRDSRGGFALVAGIGGGIVGAGAQAPAQGTAAAQVAAAPLEGHSRAGEGVRKVARRKPDGRVGIAGRLDLSASELRKGTQQALSCGVSAPRLYRYGLGVFRQRQWPAAPSHRRACVRGRGRARDDSGDAERDERVRREHVFEFGDHRQLGRLHRRRSRRVHGPDLSHAADARQPRARRSLDGRLRDDPDRHEAAGRLRRDLRAQLLLSERRHGASAARRRAVAGGIDSHGRGGPRQPWRTGDAGARGRMGAESGEPAAVSSTCRRRTARCSPRSP